MSPPTRGWSAVLLLALWPGLGTSQDSAADYFVHNLPGLPDDVPPVKMHAGHIEVIPEHDGNLFFWHFENQRIADRQRTVIWLNGGPGCSSEDGAMMEIGPYRLESENKLVMNNGSWNEFANLLFVDNPVGTGFSFVDTDSFIHELDTMAEQMVSFLGKFFELFPQYEEDELYIAGESFAGQHIPYIAKAIVARNKDGPTIPWNLKGLLIGNGWIAPAEQYEAYITYSIAKGLIKKGSNEAKELYKMLNECKATIMTDPGHVDYGDCERILSRILSMTRTSSGGDDDCVNMYDVRLKDSYPSCGMNWPPDLEYVTPYLRRSSVTKALNISPKKNTGWSECSGAVGGAFNNKKSGPVVEFLPELIEDVPVLLFSGAEDLICNHRGTEALIDNMQWNGAQGFGDAPRLDWSVEGEKAGFWQEARNLTYVLCEESSHMVPFDHPRRSQDMLHRFMNVDFSAVGSSPVNSHIDGEKHQQPADNNALHDSQEDDQNNDEGEDKKVEEAKWLAYQRSGEVVLAIAVVAVAVWGFFIWRQRRRQASYQAVRGDEPRERGSRLGPMRRTHQDGDLEAAAFDESQLDDLHVETPTMADGGKYAVGDDSDDEIEEKGAKASGAESRS